MFGLQWFFNDSVIFPSRFDITTVFLCKKLSSIKIKWDKNYGSV